MILFAHRTCIGTTFRIKSNGHSCMLVWYERHVMQYVSIYYKVIGFLNPLLSYYNVIWSFGSWVFNCTIVCATNYGQIASTILLTPFPWAMYVNIFMKPVSLRYEFVFGVTMHTRSDLFISSGIARLDKLGGFNLS